MTIILFNTFTFLQRMVIFLKFILENHPMQAEMFWVKRTLWVKLYFREELVELYSVYILIISDFNYLHVSENCRNRKRKYPSKLNIFCICIVYTFLLFLIYLYTYTAWSVRKVLFWSVFSCIWTEYGPKLLRKRTLLTQVCILAYFLNTLLYSIINADLPKHPCARKNCEKWSIDGLIRAIPLLWE